MIKRFINWLFEPSLPKAIAMTLLVAASVFTDARLREALFTPIIAVRRLRRGRRRALGNDLDCWGAHAQGKIGVATAFEVTP